MSNIILVKDTVEIKKIEVPDYKPQFDGIEELTKVRIKNEAESARIAEVLNDSIVEQIAVYLHEILKPILEYYKKYNKKLPGDICWYTNGWRFHINPCDCYSIEFIHKFGLEKADFWIKISSEGYEVFDEMSLESLRYLASHWKEFKQYTKRRIERVVENLKYEQEKEVRYHQDVINALSNFEL